MIITMTMTIVMTAMITTRSMIMNTVCLYCYQKGHIYTDRLHALISLLLNPQGITILMIIRMTLVFLQSV